MKNVKGSLILLLTAFIWGSSFVAQTTGSKYIGTFTFNAVRSFVASAFLGIIILVMQVIKGRTGKSTISSIMEEGLSESVQTSKWTLKSMLGGILCGLVLFFAMTCQQLGISLYPEGTAVSGRAGFVTATYVVIVAVIEQFRGRKLHYMIALSVLGTIVGMYFLCMSEGISNIYIGDMVVFLCAIGFTGHIMIVDYFKGLDSIKLSCVQFLTCGVLSLIVCLLRERIVLDDLRAAIFPILYAGILSSGVAYTLQMVGQKYAEPAVASIVMSLESVFAVLTGWLVLHEILTGREILGCGLVFVSVILAQLPQFFTSKESGKK